MGTSRILRALASGANNDLFVVDHRGVEAVLKRTRPGGVARLDLEAAILECLDGDGAPRLLGKEAIDSAEECSQIVMEWVQGRHLHRLDRVAAAMLGRTLGGLHSRTRVDLPAQLASPSWADYLESRLESQWEQAREAAPSAMVEESRGFLRRLGTFAAGFGADDEGRCLVHTDLIPLNVVFTAEDCRIVDWELGRIDHPEWDLASLDKAFVFEPGARAAFDAAYGRLPDPDRLRLVGLLHYSNVALWRMCSYWVRGENRENADRFLAELDEEIEWIRRNLP
ncbi:MAG: aminoglycoside phosphotransferase family protein [Fibrobacteria bacterium]|nr:aminoglycoside phosphotransferase family protein [Fibrobacteria bacterium]